MNAQKDLILRALKDGETLSPVDALNRFGCFRLAARINDLRNEGYQIKTGYGIAGGSGRAFAKYTLEAV